MRYLMMIFLFTGCSLATPGWDTRIPHQAKNTTDWTAEGALSMSGDTTHNGKKIAYSGVDITVGPDGMPTGGTLDWLYFEESDPEVVGESYRHLSDNNMMVVQGFFQTIQVLAPYVHSLVMELEQTKRELAAIKATTQPN